ncbi:PREDICTED: uncharacterized protein LOC106814214 [Priapulus caudatus]|uniref:Uncharacterized protein LOC106814214 n=1 Tax=Priapulus caudatus TaxID=37621 RepID=A0ABM1EP77_PRICU|nr:PREDICTED: uncharacterized protein LOC106814214 [Priapulus caudatus]
MGDVRAPIMDCSRLDRTASYKLFKQSVGFKSAGENMQFRSARRLTLKHKEVRDRGFGKKQKKRGKFCEKGHIYEREKCPAYGKKCRKCNGDNHFQSQCDALRKSAKPKSRYKSKRKNVYSLYRGDSDSDDYWTVRTVGRRGERKVFARMLVNGAAVRFQLDSGATCNIVPAEVLSQQQLVSIDKTQQRVLTTYDGSTIQPLGECWVKMINHRNDARYKVACVVLQENCVPILGVSAAQQMQLLEIRHENIMNVETHEGPKVVLTKEVLMEEFKDVFEGTGRLSGSLHLEIDTSVPPVVHPPRRVPIALKEALRVELEDMKKSIIAKVTTPTDWVSSLVVVKKSNGKLRICLDPKDLNKVLKRSHYLLPTVEDVLPNMSGVKVFSLFDAKNGFWHVAMDEDSSYLTTFHTPFGRYRWKNINDGRTRHLKACQA